MIKQRLTATFVLLNGLMLGPAVAAPFCLTMQGGGSQCIYYDGAACARDANRMTNGACTANPQEVRIRPRSGGDYCVVISQNASVCGYVDGNTCAHEALNQHGACVRAPGTRPAQLPEYYAPNVSR
jgi:hypothetical protein